MVTGANSGIGLETAVALARHGDRVLIACRNPAKAAAAVADIRGRAESDEVDAVPLDLASFDSIRSAAAEIAQRMPRLDVLVNNAGLILSERHETEEGFEATFGTNHLGPFLLTRLLEGSLWAAGAAGGARVVNVSSVAHWAAVRGMRFGDLQTVRRPYIGWEVYGRSKLANIYFTQVLADRWADRGVTVNALHPGAVRSGFGRDGDMSGINKAMIEAGALVYVTPQQGSGTSVFLAVDAAGGEVTGQYWVQCRRGRLSPWAKRRADAERLWNVSEALVEAGGP